MPPLPFESERLARLGLRFGNEFATARYSILDNEHLPTELKGHALFKRVHAKNFPQPIGHWTTGFRTRFHGGFEQHIRSPPESYGCGAGSPWCCHYNSSRCGSLQTSDQIDLGSS